LLETEDWYIGNASIFKQKEADRIWQGKKIKKITLNEYYDKVKSFSSSDKMQYIDINTWLPGDILAKADKMTMANSLELRVPFLDIEVSNFASKLKDNMKWCKGETKYLLREAMRDIVPEPTRTRKKLGFPTPIELMIRDHMSEVENLIFENPYLKETLNLPLIKETLFNPDKPIKENARKIYALLLLAIWHNEFFGNQ
jgi:asparagine synthase (glutamine-hydrolysing)